MIASNQKHRFIYMCVIQDWHFTAECRHGHTSKPTAWLCVRDLAFWRRDVWAECAKTRKGSLVRSYIPLPIYHDKLPCSSTFIPFCCTLVSFVDVSGMDWAIVVIHNAWHERFLRRLSPGASNGNYICYKTLRNCGVHSCGFPHGHLPQQHPLKSKGWETNSFKHIVSVLVSMSW